MRAPGGRPDAAPHAEERPDFLPMFPWYSGTSADMYRTIFDLAVSLKLFLGRFDMRTMQARAPAPTRLGSPHRASHGTAPQCCHDAAHASAAAARACCERCDACGCVTHSGAEPRAISTLELLGSASLGGPARGAQGRL